MAGVIAVQPMRSGFSSRSSARTWSSSSRSVMASMKRRPV